MDDSDGRTPTVEARPSPHPSVSGTRKGAGYTGALEDEPERPVLVSACLLGRPCRYDGVHSRDLVLEEELALHGMLPIPFCPEEHGQLGTPRPAAWIEDQDASAVVRGEARVVDERGQDVTPNFLAGAEGAVDRCAELGIRQAFLKERSPSCGVRHTHVGGVPVEGPGVTAVALEQAGVTCEGIAGCRGLGDRESD